MSKHIQLHIPEPCHENWNKMTAVEKGKFCDACQKQVVDFTRMSDAQLVAFFKRPANGSVCGRFMQDQLDRIIDIPKKRIPWMKYFFQFALPAFLISAKATAQGQLRIPGKTVLVLAPKTGKANKTEKTTAIKVEKRIRGRVIDNNGEGIPYASVFIKGTTIGVAADSTGNFTLKYTGKENSIVLETSCVGFQNMESTVMLNKNPDPIIIPLAFNETLGVLVNAYTHVMGGIRMSVGAISVVKESNIIDTICNKISPKKDSIKLYPNPLKSNTSLTIEMGRHEGGNYLVQVSAMNGAVVFNKELWFEKDLRKVNINIPPVAAGAYLLTVINKQSGKNNSEKIIVK